MQKLTEHQFQTPGIQKAYDKVRNEGLEQGKLEGLREGEIKGKTEGALEGQRRILIRQIERKFGAQLSAEQFERVQSATLAELDLLAERILDANSVEELL